MQILYCLTTYINKFLSSGHILYPILDNMCQKNVKKWPRDRNFRHILPKIEQKMWPDDKKLLI